MMPVHAALILDFLLTLPQCFLPCVCGAYERHWQWIKSCSTWFFHSFLRARYPPLSTVLVMDNMSEHHCLTKGRTSSPPSHALEGFRAATVQSQLTADCGQASEADLGTVTAQCSCAAAGAAQCWQTQEARRTTGRWLASTIRLIIYPDLARPGISTLPPYRRGGKSMAACSPATFLFNCISVEIQQ